MSNKYTSNSLVKKIGFLGALATAGTAYGQEPTVSMGLNGSYSPNNPGKKPQTSFDISIDFPTMIGNLGAYANITQNPHETSKTSEETIDRDREYLGEGIYRTEIRKIGTEENTQYSHAELGVQGRFPIIELGEYEMLFRAGAVRRRVSETNEGELVQIIERNGEVLGRETVPGESKENEKTEYIPTWGAEFGSKIWDGRTKDEFSGWGYLGLEWVDGNPTAVVGIRVR